MAACLKSDPSARSCRTKWRHPSVWRKADGCLDFARHEQKRDDADLMQDALQPAVEAECEAVILGLDRPSGVPGGRDAFEQDRAVRSEEHTSELQSLMRSSYAVFCLKKKKQTHTTL